MQVSEQEQLIPQPAGQQPQGDAMVQIGYEEPVKPLAHPENPGYVAVPPGDSTYIEMSTQLPYVPPPSYDWEPGMEYQVGQPVQREYTQIYYPGAHDANEPVEPVTFKQEKISLKKPKKIANKGCHCVGCWGASFFTSMMVFGGVVLGVVLDPLWFILPGVFYIIHWVVFCCSDTCKFLSKLNKDVNPYELTHKCQNNPGYVKWHISCYHYETRVHTVTDSNGTRTTTRRERVTTWVNSKTVNFHEQCDASPILSGLEQYRLTRIYNKVDIAFENEEMRNHFNHMRSHWIQENHRDVHFDFSEHNDIKGMISHLLTFNGKRKKFPTFLNCCIFTMLAFLTLDWVLMFWLMRHSARLDYKFVKVVHRI